MKPDQSPPGGVATSGRTASAARMTERSSSAARHSAHWPMWAWTSARSASGSSP